MSKPVPNRPYTVVKGDTLWDIAAAAYGDPRKFSIIWKTNKSNLKSDDPHWIYPGEVLWIPPDAPIVQANVDVSSDFLVGKKSSDFTIVVDGFELVAQQASLTKAIDTCSNGWAAKVFWDSTNAKLKETLWPDRYKPSKVYLGGVLMCSGILYKQKFTFSSAGRFALLEGNNPTADIIDSAVQPPYQKNGMSFRQIIQEAVEPFGIPVIFDDELTGDPDSAFKRVTASKTDKIFEFLKGLAEQKGLLISSTDEGAIFITNAKASEPVGLLEEGKFPISGACSVAIDGRKRFKTTKALGRGPKARKKYAISIDENVPRARFQTIESDDTTEADIQKAADWARSHHVIEALSFDVPVIGWYAPNGTLWREGSMVSFRAPSGYLDKPKDFLIRGLRYETDADSGQNAMLSLTPLEVFTGAKLESQWS